MPIDGGLRNRLAPGTKLQARYKGRVHDAEVTAAADGTPRYRLADGREFTSPSAAGQAVMGGIACNGWRFWSLADPEEAPTTGPPRDTGSTPPATAPFRRVPNQRGVPAGEVRWFCPACRGSFLAPDGDRPTTGPNQHRAARTECASQWPPINKAGCASVDLAGHHDDTIVWMVATIGLTSRGG